MLHEFVTRNNQELIRRCRHKEAARAGHGAPDPDSAGEGVPLFLKQLVETLRQEIESSARNYGRADEVPAQSLIGAAAARHGAEMLRLGYSIDQVVHGYGDVCQSVTELALEQRAVIGTNDFRILNRCLDEAIAGAVMSFGHAREAAEAGDASDQRFELRTISEDQERLINTAMHAFSAVRTGSIGLSGATGTVLMHTLLELRDLAKKILLVSAAQESAAPSPKQ